MRAVGRRPDVETVVFAQRSDELVGQHRKDLVGDRFAREARAVRAQAVGKASRHGIGMACEFQVQAIFQKRDELRRQQPSFCEQRAALITTASPSSAPFFVPPR